MAASTIRLETAKDESRPSRIRVCARNLLSREFHTRSGHSAGQVSEGVCETSLVVQERLLQQHGFIHGGVIATIADHTAGGAARSVSGDKDVLTVEFKINYLRPATGDRLRCAASVLRGGKTVIVAEALVYAGNAEKETLVAKLIETLFLADDPKARAGGS
jgi:uncharacterized protein (TIGR00369 family)